MTTSVASTTATVTGTVSSDCSKISTTYGPRLRVKVRLDSGIVTVWGKEDETQLLPLKRGVGVRLLAKPGKGSEPCYKFVGLTGSELTVRPQPRLAPVPPPPTQSISPVPLPTDEVTRSLVLYEQCLQGAIGLCGRQLPEGEPIAEHARQVATTIYISVTNRR